MIKKNLIEITGSNCNRIDCEKLIELNTKLNYYVTCYKNKITYYYNNKLWDKYKKYSNEYELVFTTPNNGKNISNYVPLSRAFFKLWEILIDFNHDLLLENSDGMKCLFLAESPGSFCEATQKWLSRNDRKSKYDIYSGMSLKSKDKNTPEWRSSHHFIKNVDILWGKDGTGNLYNLDNIIYLTEKLGLNSQDFITGDGGFDFSNDFNNQELTCLRLIICEILSALMLQKNGGSFILKIFDTFNSSTLKILQILKIFWKKIFIVKPLTSRPANSEKYLVCLNFCKNDDIALKKWTTWLKILVKNFDSVNLKKAFDKISYDQIFLNNIVTYNVFYSIKQIFYIQNTIHLIDLSQDFLLKNGYLHPNLNALCHVEKQRRKASKWCEYYDIPYSTR